MPFMIWKNRYTDIRALYRMCIIEIEDCSNDKIFEFLFIVVQTYIREYVRLICILYNAYQASHF